MLRSSLKIILGLCMTSALLATLFFSVSTTGLIAKPASAESVTSPRPSDRVATWRFTAARGMPRTT